MNMLLTPYVTDRAVGVGPRWRALEDTLAEFSAALAGRPVAEDDEDQAAHDYLARLADAGLARWTVPAEYCDPRPGAPADLGGDLSSTALCVIRQWLARDSGALDTAFVMQGLGSYPVALAGRER